MEPLRSPRSAIRRAAFTLACACVLGSVVASRATPPGNPNQFILDPDPARIDAIRQQVCSRLNLAMQDVAARVQASPQPTTERITSLAGFAQLLRDWISGETTLAKKRGMFDDRFVQDAWKPMTAYITWYLAQHQLVADVFPAPKDRVLPIVEKPDAPKPAIDVSRLISEERDRYGVSMMFLMLAAQADAIDKPSNQRLAEALKTMGGKVLPLQVNGEPESPGIAGVEPTKELQAVKKAWGMVDEPLNPPRAPAPAPIPEADKAAITALVKRFFEDGSKQNFDHLRELFVDPALFDELLKKSKDSKMADPIFEKMELSFERIGAADIAVRATGIALTLTDPGQEPQQHAVGFEAILANTDKGWKIRKMGTAP